MFFSECGTRLVRRALYSVLVLLLVVLPACEFCVPSELAEGAVFPVPICEVGPEASLSDSDGGTVVGMGVRMNWNPPELPVGFGMGVSKGFPEVGSSYDAWVAARYEHPSGGAVRFFGEAGPTLTRSGYDADEYEIPTGEFFDQGGGAFRQGTGLGSQNAYGVRLGIGAVANRSESKWRPFGQVGYDVFLAGAEVPDRLRFSAGITYRLGGGS